MDADARVCPFCGEPPGPGVFCEACGRNLGGVDQLPRRAEWERAAAPPSPVPVEDPGAVARFLAVMHEAGDPGAAKLRRAQPGFLGRAQHALGWIVRPVNEAREPGLFLAVDGTLHRLESATLGISNRGQTFIDVVGAETEAPVAEELAALLRANGLS